MKKVLNFLGKTNKTVSADTSLVSVLGLRDNLAKDRLRFWLYMGIMVGVTVIMSDAAFASKTVDGYAKAVTTPLKTAALYIAPIGVGIGGIVGVVMSSFGGLYKIIGSAGCVGAGFATLEGLKYWLG
ncbi:MAG: hypothetical protein HRU35_05545 [Rickettsiaceae bacterium]|nr:hypothetical protein [Rickettsiaceae bacterium]